MKTFGENESAARIPSAVVGLVTVAGVWFAARRRFGDVAGLASASVLAVLPQHVAHSRSARFYAAFALSYGIAAALGTRALETHSKRTAIGALIAFVLAMHFQVEAATLVLPLVCYALYLRARTPEHHASLGRTAGLLIGASVVAAIVVAVLPPLRDGATWLIDHLPGLKLKPGLHLDTLGKLFGVVSWWAWIPLTPAVLIGLRKAGRDGVALALQLLVPVLALAILFAPTTERGISSRYLFYLLPLLAVVVGVGVAELVERVGQRTTLTAIIGVVLAGAVVAGGPTIWRLPGAAHPGKVIPRPNWNAATTIVKTQGTTGDAILSTSPLAPAWALGRCADWVREPAAAETFLEGGRDIYCGSELISNDEMLEAYLRLHPRGWVIADPAQWHAIVDPAVRSRIERIASPVAVPDETILVWRWSV
jgi:4-amino-4-deoxy-L-arabinose transferase-like glycosyltransferase